MAKVDAPDPSFFNNPAVYSQLKPERADDKKAKGIRRDKSFSTIFDDLRGKTADQLGPLHNLPVSEETVNYLMDEVRSTGDTLKNRPLPEEIMRYKQAVRNFINYVVQNGFALERNEGIENKHKPGFRGGIHERNDRKGYTSIQVIDKKLENLAAMLVSGQMRQMELVSRLEEIRGLLVDLLQ